MSKKSCITCKSDKEKVYRKQEGTGKDICVRCWAREKMAAKRGGNVTERLEVKAKERTKAAATPTEKPEVVREPVSPSPTTRVRRKRNPIVDGKKLCPGPICLGKMIPVESFGTRKMKRKDGSVVETLQSWCNVCRAEGRKLKANKDS